MSAASTSLRVLQVEDSPEDAELIKEALTAGGYSVIARRIETEAELLFATSEAEWDLVISDYTLPHFGAPAALRALERLQLELPFIIASGKVGEEEAVALIKAGATDFIAKSRLNQLPALVERALRECATRKAHRQAILALHDSESRYRTITANLPGMVYQQLVRPDRSMDFLYVSDQCTPLLGLEAEGLRTNAACLNDMVITEDRESFLMLKTHILEGAPTINWEGRFRIPPENDIKWINLRASNRRLHNGDVLSEGIMSNITQNMTLQIDLLRSQEQLRELSSHLQLAKEQERARIARELHDELGSTLTAIKIDLLRLGSGLPNERIDLSQKVSSATNLLNHAMDTVRNVSQSLRPGILDYGLQAAIEWQTREFQRRMGIECELNCHADGSALNADAATALFRIFQETLTNITKHAGATRVGVTLAEDEEMVFLEVEDNGQGFTTTDLEKDGSYGVRNMRERIEGLGGEFEIDCGHGGGTRVCVTIPLAAQSAALSPDAPQQVLFRESLN